VLPGEDIEMQQGR